MVRAEKAWLAAGDPRGARRRRRDPVVGRRRPSARSPDLGDAIGPRRAARRRRPAVDGATGRRRRGRRLGGPPRGGRRAHARAGQVGDPRRSRPPRSRAARGRSRRTRRRPTRSSATTRSRARRCATPRSCARSRRSPCIVIGNRSAVYAPVHQLGLVALWDDGDPLLAEQLSPGVHARDAALLRQELDGGALRVRGTHPHDRRRAARRASAGSARSPAARRTSPRVVLSATREGESRGARVPSAAFAAAREALADRPGARAGRPPGLRARARVRRVPASRPLSALRRPAARITRRARCPSAPGAAARPRLDVPGLLVDPVRMASAGSERTADELGRAFPGTRVIVADGAHPITHVDARPALVVATRGAEPIASGGYRAVILLDGDRMLLADDLRIGESCLRWWSNAAALASPGAPVHLVGRRRTGRPRTRDLDPARLRAGRARRPRTAAHAADRAGRRARGRRVAPWRPPSTPSATRCPRSTTTPCSARRRPKRASRALVRFDYALGAKVTEQPARVGREPGAQDPRGGPKGGPPARAIHSEFGSTCPTSTCEEPHASRLRRHPGAGSAVAAAARGIRSRHRRRRHAPRCAARAQARAHAVAGRRRGGGARPRRSSAPTGWMPRRRSGSPRSSPTSASSSPTADSCASRCSRRPRHGWINLHFSLLPRWRGAAPVQHALIAGDEETGASVFQLVARARRRRRLRRGRPSPGAGARPPGDVLAALADDGADAPRRRRRRDRRRHGAVAPPQQGEPTLRPQARRRRRPHPLGRAAATPCSAGSAASPPSPARTRRSTERG